MKRESKKTNSSTPTSTNTLLIGAGGREHALAWKIRQSPHLGKLWLSDTTNAALQRLGRPVGVPVDPASPFQIQQFCKKHDINLVVVGPEGPLAQGIADVLRSDQCAVFGPDAAGARLEADKAWSKQLLRAASVPTPQGRTFTDFHDAVAYLESRDQPPVIKASGLAGGKGVILPDTVDDALVAAHRIMVERVFGDAGETVIIEERLTGPEVSILALVDGRTIYILDPCQDHKRLREGGLGPNTGGMGAFCPTSLVDDTLMSRIQREILVPTVDALRREGINYQGVLYAGLMLTHAGPKVLEYNVRFGDPECQPLMKRFKGDLLDTLYRTATGTLAEARIDWDTRTACCVVLTSKGYPEKPKIGFPITGIDEAEALGDVTVFHAGTKRNNDGALVTNGGRVLGVTALADTLADARDLANQACELIQFEGKHYRRDIGAEAFVSAARQ